MARPASTLISLYSFVTTQHFTIFPMALFRYIALLYIWGFEYLFFREIHQWNCANLVLCTFILLSHFLYPSTAKRPKPSELIAPNTEIS